MARTITWDELRDLAGFEAEKGCAISLYLDLDPIVTPTPGDAATRLHSLLDEAAKGDGANRRDMTHDQRVGLRADFERIRSFYESEFERDGAHGLAIFSSGLDNIWRTLPLTEAVPDEVKRGRAALPRSARARSSAAGRAPSSSWSAASSGISTASGAAGSRISPTTPRSSREGTTRAAGRRRATSATSRRTFAST